MIQVLSYNFYLDNSIILLESLFFYTFRFTSIVTLHILIFFAYLRPLSGFIGPKIGSFVVSTYLKIEIISFLYSICILFQKYSYLYTNIIFNAFIFTVSNTTYILNFFNRLEVSVLLAVFYNFTCCRRTYSV